MKLLEIIKNKKKFEIEKENYYNEYLTIEDSLNLKNFLENLSEKSYIPFSVIAVGSTTFPKNYWEEQKKLNEKFPKRNSPEEYSDIDLLFLPEELISLNEFKLNIKKSLLKMNMYCKEFSKTSFGKEYKTDYLKANFDSKYRDFKIIEYFDYGLNSIRTRLKNKTPVDLILGRQKILTENLEDKIYELRKDKKTFAVLKE